MRSSTVPWDREIDDPLDLHGDLAPALRAPIAGVYAISAGAWFSANGNGRRYASIVLNGTLNIASEAIRPVTTGGAATILSLATTRRLAARRPGHPHRAAEQRRDPEARRRRGAHVARPDVARPLTSSG